MNTQNINKEVWVLDSLPPGRPIEARGESIQFAFRGESLAFATKEDAEKWRAEYGTGGRLWHVATVPTEQAVEAKPVSAEDALTEKIQSLVESRVAEILSRAGFITSEPEALAVASAVLTDAVAGDSVSTDTENSSSSLQ